MQNYEYKVVPAPERGQKSRGVKTPQDRFAHAMTETLNRLAAEGWEYHRAETLPCAESKGFFSGSKDSTVYRSLLVFRRPMAQSDPDTATPARARPAPSAADPAPAVLATPTEPAPSSPRSRVLMAIPSDRSDADTEDAAPAPVLRAERGATAADGASAGPVFRWPLRPGNGDPQPPRPLQRGD